MSGLVPFPQLSYIYLPSMTLTLRTLSVAHARRHASRGGTEGRWQVGLTICIRTDMPGAYEGDMKRKGVDDADRRARAVLR